VKIHFHPTEPLDIKHPVVTTGTFDGVHAGHMKIIGRMREIAAASGGETVLLTFDFHPRHVLRPSEDRVKILTTFEEKCGLLEKAGIDHLVVIPFTPEFSRLSPFEYVRDIVIGLIGVHTMVVGYDHRFGRNREGDFAALNEYAEMFGFGIEEISAREIDENKVSSTKIRQSLPEGDIAKAAVYLGHPYSLRGIVTRGAGRGKGLGFPTANLGQIAPDKLIPKPGVYSVSALIDGRKFQGMMNIGTNPTFENSDDLRTEVHLFDFSGDLYGKMIEVDFTARIRDEIKFNTVAELILQLQADKEAAMSHQA
jgi:riboflavin kinase / FMN adenylyltransferase